MWARRVVQVLLVQVLAVLVAALVWAFAPSVRDWVRGGERGETHTSGVVVPVVGVSDGDSIRVSIDGVAERVRIIGIDAPELADEECFAQPAAARMQSLVQGREVRLEADESQDDRDRYGRLLRHVFTLDGVNVAEVMVAEGFAMEYTYRRASEWQGLYLEAEEAAREAEVGVWSGVCA